MSHSQITSSAFRCFGCIIVWLLALAVSAAPLSASSAARAATPERYIGDVCDALTQWLSDTGEADQAIFTALDQLGANQASVKPTRKAVLRAYRDAITASDALVEAVADAEAPDVSKGKAVAADFARTIDDLRDVYVTAKRAYDKLKAGKREAFYVAALDIEANVSSGFDDVGQPLERLVAHDDLAPIIEENATCAEVLALSSSGGPPQVSVGQCLSDAVGAVSCEEPHFGEVFFVAAHPAGLEEPYPGSSALEDYVVSQCDTAFADYTGTDPAASTLSYSWYQPEEAAWDAGDRTIICSVVAADNSELTGSVRSSGI